MPPGVRDATTRAMSLTSQRDQRPLGSTADPPAFGSEFPSGVPKNSMRGQECAADKIEDLPAPQHDVGAYEPSPLFDDAGKKGDGAAL